MISYSFNTAYIYSITNNSVTGLFELLYYTVISFTTVGYGDIYATSGIGKILTMISSLFGIAIVALPAGIITAGYMSEINTDDKYN